MRKLAFLSLALLLALLGTGAVRAQTARQVTLLALDTASFPTMRLMVDVFDANGAFVPDLSTEQITILENDQRLIPTRLELLRPGVQFAVALDPDRSFGLRNGDTLSRLERIRATLLAWAEATSAQSGDVLHLALTGSGLQQNLTPQAFREALAAYQPDLLTLKPSLDTLSQAIDAVTGAPAQPGMKRVVLYITTPPAASAVSLLQSLTQRAEALKVRVHVWMVMPLGQPAPEVLVAMKDLALRTGGQYLLFDPTLPLPDPETYLAPLRFAYALEYISAIRSNGTHTLAVEVTHGGERWASNALTFDLKVLPPNPILLSPPGQIVRQGADRFQSNFALFEPRHQEIQAIFEFPDGYPRRLRRTALYVDGILVAENTTEPFDRFLWDLSEYHYSAEHLLQVEATDELGLTNVSLAIPVQVTVIQPERGLQAFFARHSRWLLFGAISLAGLILAVSLLIGVRHSNPSQPKSKEPAERESPRRGSRLRRPTFKQPEAYLLRLRDDEQPFDAPPVPINTAEVVFGSDPLHATRVLNDPSVAPIHARLRYENDRFVLQDENSVAGTWVNYERLQAPRVLKHGDILHFGRIAYRFLLRKAPALPPPDIRSLER